MDAATDAGHEPIADFTPFLATRDLVGLTEHLCRRCPRATWVGLLHSRRRDIVQACIACFRIRGCIADTPLLARLLHHDDAAVVAAADDALWSIWLRAGDEEANSLLFEAIEAMNEQAFDRATRSLDEAIRHSPRFAEAYNQRAIAWYLREKHLRSIADCRRTLTLNPWHFGAAAGLGHCYAQLGFYERALDAYHAALKLYPRMEGVRQAIRQVRELLNSTPGRV